MRAVSTCLLTSRCRDDIGRQLTEVVSLVVAAMIERLRQGDTDTQLPKFSPRRMASVRRTCWNDRPREVGLHPLSTGTRETCALAMNRSRSRTPSSPNSGIRRTSNTRQTGGERTTTAFPQVLWPVEFCAAPVSIAEGLPGWRTYPYHQRGSPCSIVADDLISASRFRETGKQESIAGRSHQIVSESPPRASPKLLWERV